MLLWDLKLTVNCLTAGLVNFNELSNSLGSKRLLRSQNLNPTPFAIVWAVSPE